MPADNRFTELIVAAEYTAVITSGKKKKQSKLEKEIYPIVEVGRHWSQLR